MNEYLKPFVAASSFLVVFPFYIEVMNIPKLKKNYNYRLYTQIAPLYLGMLNMFSYCLEKNLNISKLKRLLIVSIISPSIVFYVAKRSNSYNFTTKEWILYGVYLFIRHFLTYFIIIYFIEQII